MRPTGAENRQRGSWGIKETASRYRHVTVKLVDDLTGDARSLPSDRSGILLLQWRDHRAAQRFALAHKERNHPAFDPLLRSRQPTHRSQLAYIDTRHCHRPAEENQILPRAVQRPLGCLRRHKARAE